MENHSQHIVHRYNNGNINLEVHYTNGKRHRIGRPAIIYYYTGGGVEREEYWLNGKRHRLDGPALIMYDLKGEIFKEHFIIGEFVEEEDFNTPGFVDAFILEHS